MSSVSTAISIENSTTVEIIETLGTSSSARVISSRHAQNCKRPVARVLEMHPVIGQLCLPVLRRNNHRLIYLVVVFNLAFPIGNFASSRTSPHSKKVHMPVQTAVAA